MAETRIQILPETVASQIAAGEVVERPASAVKELVENALDAGAGMISVELEAGGREGITVTDDGCGMGPADAELSLRRHATSKIRTSEDLRAISTFGFRGEALAALASVSHLTLTTRRRGDDAASRIEVEGGEIVKRGAGALAIGTRVEVRRLFYNTPARLKFLKSPSAERAAALRTIEHLALAHPEVAFRVVDDGRELLEVSRARDCFERMRQLWGERMAEQMCVLDGPGAVTAERISIAGFASQGQVSYPNARRVVIFVNRRPVSDRLLLRAVSQAYASLIPRGRYPGAVLFVTVRGDEVDVNVHPMKLEVRFRRPGVVFEAVYGALRRALAGGKGTAVAELASTADFGASATGASGALTTPPTGGPGAQPSLLSGRLRLVVGGQPLPAGTPAPIGGSADTSEAGVLPGSDAGEPAGGGAPGPQVRPGMSSGTREQTAETPAQWREFPLTGTATEGEGSLPRGFYSTLRPLGQIFAGFIALEADEELILVDQHAAHERVMFEQLRDELRAGGIQVQPRLVGEPIELSPARAGAVLAALEEFRALGFVIEPFGRHAVVLRGVPAAFGPEIGVRLARELIEDAGENGLLRSGEQALEERLKTLACHAAVRVGRVLAEDEIRELLVRLDRTRFRYTCPHGRLVHIRFRRREIERMFRR